MFQFTKADLVLKSHKDITYAFVEQEERRKKYPH